MPKTKRTTLSRKSKKSTQNKKVEKQFSTGISSFTTTQPINRLMQDKNRRGLQVYTVSQIINQTGRDAEGRLLNWGFQYPYFYLSIPQRVEMAKLSSPVLGIVSSRMNRIAGINFNVVPIRKREDRIAEELKFLKSQYDEYKEIIDLKYITIKAKIVERLKSYLPDLLPDLSNFNNSILRWSQRIRNENLDKGEEIAAWLREPNADDSWESFIKKFVFDYHVHGAVSTYKQYENNRLENFGTLPGGTVYRLKAPYFSQVNAFVQVVMGYEPQIFFSKEIMYAEYLPISGQNHSLVPLEALINKVAESLFFDRLMAEQADGTKPPQKLVIITNNNSPFGDFDKDVESYLEVNEQKRIETKLNEPRKGAIMTFSGNDAKVIDLTRENTMAVQNVRQKDIREEVALVFNMSNMEINLTGSGDVSGRATSETQQEIEQGKGIIPILRTIEEKITREILPFRYGPGFMIEFDKSRNERGEVELDLLKLQTGELTVNELRESKNKTVFKEDEYNKPQGYNSNAGDNATSPVFMKQI